MSKIKCLVCGNSCDGELIDYCLSCGNFICDECSELYGRHCDSCLNGQPREDEDIGQ